MLPATANTFSAPLDPGTLGLSRPGDLVLKLTPRTVGVLQPWYRARVTEPLTLAARIRQLAADRGYADVETFKDVPLEVRQDIAEEIGKRIQHVNKALSQGEGQGAGGGRPRTHTDRCPLCEQALLTHSAHEAIERNTPKFRSGRKR